MKKFKSIGLMFALVFVLILTGCSQKEDSVAETDYKYITAAELKTDIEDKKDMVLLDIQPKDAYDKAHINGAIATYAYPGDTAEDKAKLDNFINEQKDNKLPIVIICPGGGQGAKNTWDYLTEKGIDESRLLILENGQKGWPYDELLEK